MQHATGSSEIEPSWDDLVGRQLGEFMIREKIGQGAFGAVFAAYQQLLAREAAIKVLHRRHRGKSDLVRLFIREAQLASRFDHPYAAHIYSFGAEEDGLLWIAMERVRGTPLSHLVRARGPMTLDRFAPLFERLCEVVDSAHEQQIIHRDLKPSNVMVLSRAGRLFPKLLDLGVAHLAHEVAGSGGPGPVPLIPDSASEYATAVLSGAEQKALRQVSTKLRTIDLALGPEDSFTGHTVVGSPGYMAPELWRGYGANAASDIYALGVLAFECLAGHRPFESATSRLADPTAEASDTAPDGSRSTARSLAELHVEAPVPSLGEFIGAEASAAIQKALSKAPESRFSSALEFAAALGAGAADRGARSMPELDPDLVEQMITRAPQPLAEATAALEAVTNRHEQSRAIADAVEVVARYLGAIAVACRARVAPASDKDGPANRLLGKLRRDSLTSVEWLDLAAALTRSFEGRREAHPVPELWDFLLVEDGSPSDDLVGLRSLVDPRGSDTRSPTQRLAVLGRALREMSPLMSYPLVVHSGSRVEKWMGVRRSWREPAIARADLEPHRPVLLDADRGLALELWPAVQAMAPTPAAERELFFIAGHGRFGARLRSFPIGFERHDESVWSWFDAEILEPEAGDAVESAGSRAPYRGLESFSESDADDFFGREKEAEAFANRLRVQSLIAVVGPSGVGKSSFVHAGVIPMLPPSWRAVSVRPGPAPLTALAAAFGVPRLAGDIRRDPEALRRHLEGLAGDERSTLLLICDQFEEVVTLCSDHVEANVYTEALALAASGAQAPVRIVLTLRDDFLIRVQRFEPLRERIARGIQLLSTPAPADLERILTEPARRVGYELADGLAEEMVEEVADQPGALALISFTARELWELRDRKVKRLTRASYRALGGVGGALAHHAEAMLQEMSDGERAVVREVFRHLVTGDGTRAVLSRAELGEVLASSTGANTVVASLIDARLLIASDDDAVDNRVEIIHETLLSSWPRLVEWQREDAENARLRDQIRDAARQWIQRERPRGLLWRGDALLEYRLWRNRTSSALTDAEEEFASASLGDERRGKRRRRIALATVFVGLVIGLAALSLLNRKAERNAELAASNAAEATTNAEAARAATLNSYVEQGRRALVDNQLLAATTYLGEAYRSGDRRPEVRLLLARGLAALDAQGVALGGHESWVNRVAFNRDTTLVATASKDGRARIFAAAGGEAKAVLDHGGDEVSAIAFAPEDASLATAAGRAVRLWSLDGREQALIDGHAQPVWALYFAANGARLVSVSRDAVVISDSSGARVARVKGGAISATAVASDGSFATGTVGGDVALFDADGRIRRRLAGHAVRISSMRFSASGDRLATADRSGLASLWDTATGARVHDLRGHAGPVRAVDYSADGSRVLTASADRTARLWDPASGRAVAVLSGHRGIVGVARFAPDGRTAITAATDGVAMVWDAETGALIGTLEGHEAEIWDAAFSADGAALATASYDGTARLWTPAALPRGFVLANAGTEQRSVRWSRDGTRLVAVGGDGVARVFAAAGGEPLHSTEIAATELWDGALSPDGTRAALAAASGAIVVWDFEADRITTVAGAHPEDALRIVFSADGARVYSGGMGGSIVARDSASGAPLLRFEGHSAAVWSIAVSADGERIASASDDKTARVWDSETGAAIATIAHDAAVNAVDFSADARRLLTAGEDGRVAIYDLETGATVLAFRAHPHVISNAELSADDALVLTSSFDGTARIWSASSGKLLVTLDEHDGGLYAARFNADATAVASAGLDGTIRRANLPRETREATAIAELLRCRVPFRLRRGQLSAVATACP